MMKFSGMVFSMKEVASLYTYQASSSQCRSPLIIIHIYIFVIISILLSFSLLRCCCCSTIFCVDVFYLIVLLLIFTNQRGKNEDGRMKMCTFPEDTFRSIIYSYPSSSAFYQYRLSSAAVEDCPCTASFLTYFLQIAVNFLLASQNLTTLFAVLLYLLIRTFFVQFFVYLFFVLLFLTSASKSLTYT